MKLDIQPKYIKIPYPLVNIQKLLNIAIYSEFSKKNVIFHSYVSLPEGIFSVKTDPQNRPQISQRQQVFEAAELTGNRVKNRKQNITIHPHAHIVPWNVRTRFSQYGGFHKWYPKMVGL